MHVKSWIEMAQAQGVTDQEITRQIVEGIANIEHFSVKASDIRDFFEGPNQGRKEKEANEAKTQDSNKSSSEENVTGNKQGDESSTADWLSFARTHRLKDREIYDQLMAFHRANVIATKDKLLLWSCPDQSAPRYIKEWIEKTRAHGKTEEEIAEKVMEFVGSDVPFNFEQVTLKLAEVKDFFVEPDQGKEEEEASGSSDHDNKGNLFEQDMCEELSASDLYIPSDRKVEKKRVKANGESAWKRSIQEVRSRSHEILLKQQQMLSDMVKKIRGRDTDEQ